MTDVSLEVRIWIDGQLVVNDKITSVTAGHLSEDHTQLVADATAAGKKWLVQITDPEAPEDQRHVRFGDDTAGMVDPIAIPTEDLPGELHKRFGA